MEPWLILAGFAAGAINAIAGGGPVLTLAALVAAGIDPRIANLTSTVALCPGQIVTGWAARGSLDTLAGRGHARWLALGTALIGGAGGAALLLLTGSSQFAAIVPWLILFATGLYAWSGRGSDTLRGRGLRPVIFAGALAVSAIYGGYFGGGNSFVVLALLALAGLPARSAADAKNALIAAINLGAVTVLAGSGAVDWSAALAVGLGGIAGSLVGVRLLDRIRPALLRPLVIACGLALAGWFLVT